MKKIKNKDYALFFILLSVSLFFLFKAFKMAYLYQNHLDTSYDFGVAVQAAKFFWQDKIDIYKLALENGTSTLKSNYEYLLDARYPHLLYILLYPFTLFSIQLGKLFWFITNLIFLILITQKLIKIYDLNFRKSLILFTIFSSMAPLQNCLTMGQNSILIIYFLTSYYYNKNCKFIFLTLSSIKYSCSFFFIFLSFIKKENNFLYLVLINFLAIIFFSIFVENFYFLQIFNPIIVALKLGNSNNFGVITNFVFFNNIYYYIFFLYLIFLFFFIKSKYKKFSNEFFIFFLLSSLIFIFSHGLYDSVLLFPLIAYILSKKKYLKTEVINIVYIFFISYYPYIRYLNDSLFSFKYYSLVSLVFSLISLLVFAFRILKDKTTEIKTI